MQVDQLRLVGQEGGGAPWINRRRWGWCRWVPPHVFLSPPKLFIRLHLVPGALSQIRKVGLYDIWEYEAFRSYQPPDARSHRGVVYFTTFTTHEGCVMVGGKPCFAREIHFKAKRGISTGDIHCNYYAPM